MKKNHNKRIYLFDNDFKKVKSMLNQQNSLVDWFSNNIYYSIFNKRKKSISLIFFIFVIVSIFENWLINLAHIFILKFIICFIFGIPVVVILFEYDAFLNVESLFESKTYLIMKMLILFKKYMTFSEILIFCILFELIEIKYIKNLYINEEFLGQEILNRKIFKQSVYKKNFLFLLCNFYVNAFYLWYLASIGHLRFELLDDSLKFPQETYYFIFLYFSSRKFILLLYKNSKQKKIFGDEHSKLYLISLVLSSILILYTFSSSLTNIFISFTFSGLYIALYEHYGIFSFFIAIIISILKQITFSSLIQQQSEKVQLILIDNFSSIILSYIFSIVFIFIVIYMDNDTYAKIYNKIYTNIFTIKLFIDLCMVSNYIYRLFKQNTQDYYEKFLSTYKLFFMGLSVSYIIIFTFVFLKINLVINPKDVDFFFEDVKHLKYDKFNSIDYGPNAPYYEIKLYVLTKKVLSNFSPEKNFNSESYSIKIIYNLCVIIIFGNIGILINNASIFYIVYFIIVQFLQGPLNILRIFVQFLAKVFHRKGNNSTLYYEEEVIKNEQYKLIYILLYPYLVVIWKFVISNIFFFFYENIIAKFEFLLFGKMDPIGNVIYQFLSLNYRANTFRLIDFIFLVVLILPNTLATISFHLFKQKMTFFSQIYICFNLIGIFFSVHPLINIMGIINLFVILQLIEVNADTDTFEAFEFWFFLWGIQNI